MYVNHLLKPTKYNLLKWNEGNEASLFHSDIRNWYSHCTQDVRVCTLYVLTRIYGFLKDNFVALHTVVMFTDKKEMQQSYTQIFLLSRSQQILAQMGYHRVIREQYSTNHGGIYIKLKWKYEFKHFLVIIRSNLN